MLPVIALTAAIAVHADSTPCTDPSKCLTSPLATSLSTIPNFLSAALTAMVKIAVPIITIFMVYSGFLFVTAQGNKSKLETAKLNFFYTILGAVLILGAWILANLIGSTVTQLLG